MHPAAVPPSVTPDVDVDYGDDAPPSVTPYDDLSACYRSFFEGLHSLAGLYQNHQRSNSRGATI